MQTLRSFTNIWSGTIVGNGQPRYLYGNVGVPLKAAIDIILKLFGSSFFLVSLMRCRRLMSASMFPIFRLQQSQYILVASASVAEFSSDFIAVPQRFMSDTCSLQWHRIPLGNWTVSTIDTIVSKHPPSVGQRKPEQHEMNESSVRAVFHSAIEFERQK